MGSRIGKIIAQYRIVEALGEGGMGSVYKAIDTKLERPVVLKLLSNELVGEENARKRFMREARLASALDHPNICMTYEIAESDGFYYIAMQFIEGQTLKDAIKNRPLATPALISIALQAADAFAAAHDSGIVHRDIKPQNIMITPRGQAKVLDFGLAKSLDERAKKWQPDLTEIGQPLGTPAYMSPEQARLERLDRRSDIFSFGTVLYEMATGVKPFTGKSNVEILYAVCNHTPEPIVQYNKQAPPGLQEILDTAMAKSPLKRYQSMQAMLADLKRLGADSSRGSDVPDGVQTPFARVERVRPGVRGFFDMLLPKSLRSTASSVSNRTASGASTTSAGGSAITNISSSGSGAPIVVEDDFPLIQGQYKTLAIVPFRSLGDADNVWCLSFLEALITELTNFKSLSIRPSSYVTKYLNQEINPADVGHALGVDAVLAGTFLRGDMKVRVTAQLIDTASGNILWSSKIDAMDSDEIRLQDTVCQRLAAQLSGKQKSNGPFDLLRDENERVRANAVSTLKYSTDPQAVEALVSVLSDTSITVATAAAEALVHFGRAAAPALMAKLEEALREGMYGTARFATRAAGLISSPELLPLLLDALTCEDSMTASEAALALGRLRDHRAVADLIEALTRADANVRFTCAQALGELSDPLALEALEVRLREDEDEGVRAKAFWAIKHMGRLVCQWQPSTPTISQSPRQRE